MIRGPSGAPVETDAVVIGAGPVGLFAVFELGLVDIKARRHRYPRQGRRPVRRALSREADLRHSGPADRHGPGAHRPPDGADQAVRRAVFISASGSTSSSAARTAASSCARTPARSFLAKVVVVAAGGGSFTPKRPPLEGIEAFEGTSVHYSVRRMEDLRGKDVLIVGGGDSALDWTLNLAPVAKSLTLLHRRDEFRGAPHSVEKMRSLVAEGKVRLMIGQVTALHGAGATSRSGRPSRRRTARSASPSAPCCRSSGSP